MINGVTGTGAQCADPEHLWMLRRMHIIGFSYGNGRIDYTENLPRSQVLSLNFIFFYKKSVI